jgi:hypothetical protein
MGTQIQIGPTGRQMLPLTVLPAGSSVHAEALAAEAGRG